MASGSQSDTSLWLHNKLGKSSKTHVKIRPLSNIQKCQKVSRLIFPFSIPIAGTSNDSWTGGSIVAQLNPDRLVNIQHVFQDLQPQVKLKLLLS